MIVSAIPITISCAAFLFSVFTWRERKVKDQRDLFLTIHEHLIDVDLQRGRRILYHLVHSVEDAKALFRDKPDDYDLANRALAMLDVAALYVERGYVDRQLFKQEWGRVYARIMQSGQYFIAERIERSAESTSSLWAHLQLFAKLGVERTGPADARMDPGLSQGPH